MSLILNIETSIDKASLCLAENGSVIQLSINENQKDHASWLHGRINEMLKENKFTPTNLSAIAVSIGPGSYTGLRIGLATAKGFCFALHIPLITITSLQMMACSVQEEAVDLICPLIDARRMEVFTATYDKHLHELSPPVALIINEKSFSELLSNRKILFCGNGCNKLKPLLNNPNAVFSITEADASHLSQLADLKFRKKEFADLAYSEPLYIKEFYTHALKK